MPKMDEVIFYSASGPQDATQDRTGALSLAVATTLHSQSTTTAYRHASSQLNGAAITGVQTGDRIFVAAKNKALISVWSWGKEAPEQRIPVPEQLGCLTLCPNMLVSEQPNDCEFEEEEFQLPRYRLPQLLIGGGLSGKLYIWDLSSGLLLSVRDAHYQRVTQLKCSSDGSTLVSVGKDARCLVWNTLDLVQLQSGTDDEAKPVKPVHVLADHSLEITDVALSNSVTPDAKLYTASCDSTIRVYDLRGAMLLTTFVLPFPIHSIAVDVADRAIFAGFSNGNIRQINMYAANPATNVLEALGGHGKVITLANDDLLKETITYHSGSAITQLKLSLDGSLLISGDTQGRIVASDIVSRQVVKEFKESVGAITAIDVFQLHKGAHGTEREANQKGANRPVPTLKRELNQGVEQDILFQVGNVEENEMLNMEFYLDRVAQESLVFENLQGVNSKVSLSGSATDGDKDAKIKELEEKLGRLSEVYRDLRSMYDELYEEHNK